MNKTLPGFFLVGAPKCGTSTLADLLAQHPDLFVTTPREPNFFGADLLMQRHFTSLDDYLAQFETQPRRIGGEGTTWYLYSETAPQEIFDLNPAAKILMILRNPLTVVHSLHSYRLYYGNEHEQDLAKVLRREEKALTRWRETGERKDVMQIYLDVARYSSGVRRYFDRFGRDQVKVLWFDELRDSPSELVRGVYEFLGVSTDFIPVMQIKNEVGVYKNDRLRRLLITPSDGIRRVARVVPQSWRLVIGRSIRRLNTAYGHKPAIAQNVKDYIVDAVRDDVVALEALVKQDLSTWRSGVN